MIVINRRITGLTSDVIAELVAEEGPLWHERHQAKLASRPRKRAVGGGPKHRLVFIDRLLATLVHLRHAVTHEVLACWFGVDRSTITRAVNEIRPLLASTGSPGVGGVVVGGSSALLGGVDDRDDGEHEGDGLVRTARLQAQ
ncbi:transposase family protein [[Kitasatospora] papulosa]|uniref:helix-turn-helix domain-containing protein n=1 Tax=[Kitasatospora] papulosa TaxID=1464011 RepID=UPI00369477FF